MPTDFKKYEDLLQQLEGKSYKPYDQSKTAPDTPPAPAEPPAEPSDVFRTARGATQKPESEMDWSQQAAYGVAHGGASALTKAEQLFGYTPSEGLQKYADAPSPGMAGDIGRGLGEAGTVAAMASPLGWIARAMAGIPLAASHAIPVFKQGAGWVGQATPYLSRGWQTGLSNVAGRATAGAAAGAVEDPEHPGMGAGAGAVTGLAPGVAGRVLKSPTGQFFAGHALPFFVANEVMNLMEGAGFTNIQSRAIWPTIVWNASPVGKKLRFAGRSFFDKAGNVVGTIPAAAIAGAAGGRATQGNEDAIMDTMKRVRENVP